MKNNHISGNLKASLNQDAFRKKNRKNNNVSVLADTSPSGVVATEPDHSVSTSTDSPVDTSKQIMITFPATVAEHSNFLTFRAIDQNSTTVNSYSALRKALPSFDDKNEENILLVMCLSAPLLDQQINHDYNSASNQVASDAVQSGLAGLKGADGLSDFVSAGGKVAASLVGGDIGNAARGAVSNDVGRAVALSVSSVVASSNHNQLTAYKGTSLRTQTLNYSFRPQSLDELKEVGRIITAFEKFGLPTKQKGVVSGNKDFDSAFNNSITLLKTPPVWLIEEVRQKDSHTPRFLFGPAGITSVKKSQSPDSYWKTWTGTSDPQSIDVEITFQETIPLDQQIFDNDQESSVKALYG